MAYVVTLAGFRPPPRLDAVLWTQAQIEESDEPGGPWVPIDTQAIAAYADPADPPTLSFTTDDAVLEAGWYRILFLDTPGAGMAPSSAVAASGAGFPLPPTADDVRDRSELLQSLYPSDPVDGEVEAALREVVSDAVALVEQLTCRVPLDQSLPDELERIALRAVTLKAEEVAVGRGRRSAKSSASARQLKGFSAGPYSESYFGPEEAAKAHVLSLNPALHEALWALATEECRQTWLALWTGEQAPGAAVQSFAYAWDRRLRSGY